MKSEPAPIFGMATLTPKKEMVRKSYEETWDHANVSLISEILYEGFTFRGSLDPTLAEHVQFCANQFNGGGPTIGIAFAFRVPRPNCA